jgi:ABC-2 type transport system ATP-binding protein
MNDSVAIEVHELAKTYREGLFFRRSFEALKDVSLQVHRGEIFGLLGPNGAGKTTFVKLLLGIVRKTHGRALMLGRPAGDRLGRRRVGYLPENLRIARHHTARTALSLFGQLSGLTRSEILPRRDSLLARVALADRAKDPVRKYSKGMLQRLGVAIALLHDPDLLFLDEPTDGLDPVGRADMRRLMQQLQAAGKTVFLNSHLLQEVELVCDRVAILDRGELRGVGSVEQLVPQQFQGINLELELQGSEATVRRALSMETCQQLEWVPPDLLRVRLRVPEQSEVDRCVDKLRAESVSIIAMSRRRVSLEDAFLEVLARPAPDAGRA